MTSQSFPAEASVRNIRDFLVDVQNEIEILYTKGQCSVARPLLEQVSYVVESLQSAEQMSNRVHAIDILGAYGYRPELLKAFANAEVETTSEQIIQNNAARWTGRPLEERAAYFTQRDRTNIFGRTDRHLSLPPKAVITSIETHGHDDEQYRLGLSKYQIGNLNVKKRKGSGLKDVDAFVMHAEKEIRVRAQAYCSDACPGSTIYVSGMIAEKFKQEGHELAVGSHLSLTAA